MTDQSGRLIIVDDEFSVRDSLTEWFRKDGYQVRAAESGAAALRSLAAEPCDVALLDIKMPGMDGLELQERIHRIDPDVAVIMITAFASVDTAVRSLKHGAFDYVTKPIDPDELSHLVRRALEQKRLRRENAQLRETIDGLAAGVDIVGESPAIKRVLELVQNVARTDATVLIRGESGTGKELVARAIHATSQRRYCAIIPVNCGALPEELLESELFGHERGAFTGAQFRRKGKLELVDGGTLFLDEIGTISQRMQVDLLRVLETKEFTRLGGSRPITVDFRVICATNDDLERLVEQRRFREDLYYRINVFAIQVPPLRERREDIPLLARHCMRELALQMDKRIKQIAPDALDCLMRHDWPGNVRELKNAIERAMVVGTPPSIRRGDLPLAPTEPSVTRGATLADVERAHVERVLGASDWNISRAAETLGIDRTTLYAKIKRFNLRRPANHA